MCVHRAFLFLSIENVESEKKFLAPQYHLWQQGDERLEMLHVLTEY